MDAIALLKQDHRDVEKLFKAFEAAEADKSALAEQICQMLTVHATIEEEIFYPAAREALGDEGEVLLNEAEVEHEGAKELIAKIEHQGDGTSRFEAQVTVLAEYIRHHVKEEEGELFPKVKKSDLDLDSLGEELEARKAELSTEAGSMENPAKSESKVPGDGARASPAR